MQSCTLFAQTFWGLVEVSPYHFDCPVVSCLMSNLQGASKEENMMLIVNQNPNLYPNHSSDYLLLKSVLTFVMNWKEGTQKDAMHISMESILEANTIIFPLTLISKEAVVKLVKHCIKQLGKNKRFVFQTELQYWFILNVCYLPDVFVIIVWFSS